jgi:hypothetical protein
VCACAVSVKAVVGDCVLQETPLLVASFAGHSEIVRKLLTAGMFYVLLSVCEVDKRSVKAQTHFTRTIEVSLHCT